MSIYAIINIHLSILLRLFLWGSWGGWRLSQLPYSERRCIPWTGCQSDAGHSFKIQLPHAQGQLQIGFLGWCRRMWPSLHRTPTSLQPTPLGWIATTDCKPDFLLTAFPGRLEALTAADWYPLFWNHQNVIKKTVACVLCGNFALQF